MADFGEWLLQRKARSADTRARQRLQQATALVQHVQSVNTPQATGAALAAISQAIRDATALTEATTRLIAHAQKRAEGRLPTELSARVERERQALTFLAQQLTPAAQATAAQNPPNTQLPAIVPLQNANAALQRIDYALTDVGKTAQDTQAALAADQARQQYLAQFGGIDPDDIMAQIKSGQYPTIPAGIMLHKNELALCALSTALAEDRKTSRHVGGYSGLSVPVVKGVRFRVGSYQGHTITSERLTRIDQGVVVVTTQRILFNGAKRTLALPIPKVLNTVVYRDGVDVRTENRAKREVFMCDRARLLNTYILIACQLSQPT